MGVSERSAGVGRFTRLGLGLQVGLLVLLALGVAVLTIAVFDRGSLRWRRDLTVDRANSLDPQTLELLRGLPGPVTVDLFFRPAGRAAQAVVARAQSLAEDFFADAGESAPDRLVVKAHDLVGDLARVEARLDELRLDSSALYGNTPYGQILSAVAVSRGERRTVFRLIPDACEVDWGDPYSREEPRILEWRGEEVFAEALGQVSSDQAPKVVFSIGQGELSGRSGDPQGYAVTRLWAELAAEGFELDEWSPQRDGPVPADADVLAIVGASEPFLDAGRLALDDFLTRGGRLLLALPMKAQEQESELERLLLRYGMRLVKGLVCAPVVDPRSGLLQDGRPECAELRIPGKDTSSSHPITRPLWERNRNLLVSFSRSFERGATPEGGTVLDLISSPADAWRDLPGPDGLPDFRFETGREDQGRVRLAMASEFPARTDLKEVKGRVVGLPTPSFLDDRLFDYNRDFAINCFDWLADRDFRVRVAAKDLFESKLDLARDPKVARTLAGLGYLPPLAALLVGGLLFVLRRRG
jgi:hypothetical protein